MLSDTSTRPPIWALGVRRTMTFSLNVSGASCAGSTGWICGQTFLDKSDFYGKYLNQSTTTLSGLLCVDIDRKVRFFTCVPLKIKRSIYEQPCEEHWRKSMENCIFRADSGSVNQIPFNSISIHSRIEPGNGPRNYGNGGTAENYSPFFEFQSMVPCRRISWPITLHARHRTKIRRNNVQLAVITIRCLFIVITLRSDSGFGAGTRSS